MNTGPEEASRNTPTRSLSCGGAETGEHLSARRTPHRSSRGFFQSVGLHFTASATQTPAVIGKGTGMHPTRAESYDVVVVGGGSAGVAAAVAAARIGARTLLVEAAGFLGGAATLRNVLTYCGLYTLGPKPRPAIGGVAQEVLAALRALGALVGPKRFRGVFVVFDPEAVKRVLDDIALEAGVDVLLHALLIAAERDGNAVRAVTVQDRSGPRRIEARAFVDASGDCDLVYFAGALRVTAIEASSTWARSAPGSAASR